MVSQPLSQRYIRRKKRTNLEILVQLGNTELSYLTKREGRGRESHELTCPEEKKYLCQHLFREQTTQKVTGNWISVFKETLQSGRQD